MNFSDDFASLPMYLLYVFAGYYIKQGVMSKIPVGWVAVGAVLSFGICYAYQCYVYTQPYDYLVSYQSVGLLICGIFLFELLRRVVRGQNRLVTYIAKIAFGIYFVHIVLMQFAIAVVDFSFLGQLVRVLVLAFGSLVASVLIIFITAKIPLLKKYLYLVKE